MARRSSRHVPRENKSCSPGMSLNWATLTICAYHMMCAGPSRSRILDSDITTSFTYFATYDNSSLLPVPIPSSSYHWLPNATHTILSTPRSLPPGLIMWTVATKRASIIITASLGLSEPTNNNTVVLSQTLIPMSAYFSTGSDKFSVTTLPQLLQIEVSPATRTCS